MLKTIISILGNLFFTLKNKALIFMYHSVGESKSFFTVTPEQFENQLRHLKNTNTNLVSLDTLIKKIQNREALSGEVVLTFDDGYVDFKEVTLPLLEKYKIPATVFWIPGFAGKTYKTSDGAEFPVMTEEDVRQISGSPYVSVMSHSITHADLPLLSKEEVTGEIGEGRKRVESITNTPAPYFAYPKGRFTPQTIEIVRKADLLHAAMTVSPGYIALGDNLLSLPRVPIDSKTNFRYFTLCISGGAELYFLVKRWITYFSS